MKNLREKLMSNKKLVIALSSSLAVVLVIVGTLVVFNVKANDSERDSKAEDIVADLDEDEKERETSDVIGSMETADTTIAETTIVSTEVVDLNAGNGGTQKNNTATSGGSGGTSTNIGSSENGTNDSSGGTVDTPAVAVTPDYAPAPTQDSRVASILNGEVDMPKISMWMFNADVGAITMAELQSKLNAEYPSFGFLGTTRSNDPEIWANTSNYTFVSSACGDVFIYIP